MSERQLLTEIGPYRIEGRLGAGGMGEVYRAYDARLDRSVAVKLIRPESSADQTARERFRREARAAAALTHPSIVRIYDVVASGEGEAIVMELVEGELLSQRIARGPLPVDEAVRLGRQIAEGLAAAHRRGILHRDLKVENVIITPDGEAKIMDFGLAKRLDGEPEGSLTRSDAVIGTFRAMSPEQARGMALDHRSDLFSFGVLLYEMLTGVSPFRTGSAPDTLMRICTARQVPVRELRPEVPEGMSNLVDCLLEKDPMLRPGGAREVAREFERLGGRRLTGTLEEEPTLSGSVGPPGPRQPGGADQAPPAWRWAAAGAMVLVLTGLAAVFAGRHPPAEPLPLHVAVPKPSLASPDADGRAALLVSGVRLAILQSLTGIEGIVPLASEQVDPVEGTPKEIARAVAAGEVLASRVDCGAESCRIELSRVRSDGSFLWAQSFEAPLDRPYLLPEPVAGYLREAYKDRRILAGRPRLEARPQDYVEYLKLRQTYDSEQQRDPSPEVLARIAVIRRGSPHFLEAMLLEAEMLIYRFKIRRDAMDLEKASQILQAARELAPADPRPLRDLFNLAMTRGDLTQAESVERDLMRLQPGAQLAMVEEAQLLERRGSTKEAREMMQKAVRSHPSWRNLAFAAEMDFRLGHFASARQYLEQLLDRFPGYYVGRSMLAQVELISGDSERAIELYTQIVARSPEVADVVNLGIAYMLAGRYADAEQRFRTAAGKEPKSPLIALNLGDACLLRGDATEAVTIYQHVLDLMERDPSASEWQLQSVRAQSLAHLHRPREAVEAVQEVLRLAPGNAQATYESSLVYALLGDQASALFNAERALELGVDQRWFSLPWFDALRQTPAFRGRLAALAAKSSRS